MTPAPLFGLLLSLLGVGGLPEIVKIGERIFDAHAVCWMFSRLTYSQNNQAVFLMSVNKQKAIKKLPFGEFFVERIIALLPAKYHPWRPQIQLKARCSFLQSCPQVCGGANQRAGQDPQRLTTLGSD